MSVWSFLKTPRGAAYLSALCPGLGLAIRGYGAQAAATLLLGILFLGTTVLLAFWRGPAIGIFTGMLLVLPWWVFQVFHSSLIQPQGLRATWQIVWQRGLDIQYLGGLFIVAAATDVSIILANPSYNLHVLCTRPTGALGLLAKVQSPTFHILIGYGFLRRTRWALLVYLVYAGYGLMNALVNFACEGYGRIRTVFLLTLLAFTVYVVFRRDCFRQQSSPSPLLTPERRV